VIMRASSRSERRRIERRRGSRGYTSVEVLCALILFAIGAAGAIGMLRVSIQGSEDARRFDMGNSIANGWLSRLQRDATLWTEPNASSPTTLNVYTNTKFLRLVGACGSWCNPPASTPPAGMTGSFDNFGRDLAPDSPDAYYCAQYRLQWIADPGIPPAVKLTGLMRGEVRVFWSRTDRAPIGDCSAAAPDAPDASTKLHFVYATTSVRGNALR